MARDGLLMLGERQLASTIEDLTARIDTLGGVSVSTLPNGYEALRAETERAAIDLIAATGPGLPSDALRTRISADPSPSQTASSRPPNVRDLLNRLLDGAESAD